MILQNLVFPKEGICQETELYIHAQEGAQVCAKEGRYIISAGSEVDFLTYFNCFSACKWERYTTIDDVVLTLIYKGECRLSLWEAVWEEDGIKKRRMNTINVETPLDSDSEKNKCRMFFPFGNRKGVVYARMKAESDIILYSGFYEATSPETVENPVELAIGICTYKREDFVKKTLATLKECFTENPSSPLYGHLHIYVADNGQTLSEEELSDESIRIIKNKNAGGAGGFGRCMLEALKDKERLGLTNLLLMDDDIMLEPESLFRTYAILKALRPVYADWIIGGGLLRLDLPFIQHANGEMWNDGAMGFTKQGYDLRKRESIVKNEQDFPIEYNGWWYCCLPLKEGFRGFPLPLFIHRDDIEYGLRFGGRIMTFNGIGVWHSTFQNRRTSPMEYYDMRNALITCACHNPTITCPHMIKWMWRHMLGQMLRFRTSDQRLTVRAVRDFCKGVRFLKKTDPCKLHAALMKKSYVMQDVTDELKRLGVDPEESRPSPEHVYEDKSFSKKHLLSVNGWLLPGYKEPVAMPMGDHPDALYRRKRVLLYDPDTAEGFYVTRKRRDLLVTLWRLIRVACILMGGYRNAVSDFQENQEELKSESFWEDYLA